MSLINHIRKRLPKDLIAPFRIIGMLLPLACIIEICAASGIDISNVRQKSLGSFTYFFPPIYAADYNAYRALFLIGALLIITFYGCPDRYKKPFLTIAAAIYIAFFLNIEFASAYVAGIAFLWLRFRYAVRPVANLFAIALFAALIGTLAFTFQEIQRILACALTVMTVVKAYGEVIDLEASGEALSFCDHFLLLAGGFPCNFVGPCYFSTTFNKTFLTKSWEEIARKGVALIYSGFLKLTVVLLYYSALNSGLIWRNPAAASGGPYLSTAQLWAYGFVGFLNYLMIQVGCYQLQQGINRLFGYDLKDQCEKPWLSNSPLDFWRRLTVIDREYMLKYVFYPTYRVFGSPYVPMFMVFHVLALQQFLKFDLPGGGLEPIRLTAAFIREGVGCWQFSLACSLEIAYRTFVGSSDLATIQLDLRGYVRRFLTIAALWAFFIASFFQRWVFFLPSPWPTEIRGTSVTERYVALWSCLAGYCWNPNSSK